MFTPCRSGFDRNQSTNGASFEYNLAYIPDDFEAEQDEPFDPEYMRALFDLGYEMAGELSRLVDYIDPNKPRNNNRCKQHPGYRFTSRERSGVFGDRYDLSISK